MAVYIFGCAPAGGNPAVSKTNGSAASPQTYEFPIQIFNSLTTCSGNTCVFAVKVQMSEKKLTRLVCDFRPQGLDITPIIMDTFEKPQAVVGDIIQTTVSKTCRTTGKPDAMTINCGRGSFAWSTPLDMSDPAIAQLVYRSISDQIIFSCYDTSQFKTE